jgi:hypothetical protein
MEVAYLSPPEHIGKGERRKLFTLQSSQIDSSNAVPSSIEGLHSREICRSVSGLTESRWLPHGFCAVDCLGRGCQCYRYSNLQGYFAIPSTLEANAQERTDRPYGKVERLPKEFSGGRFQFSGQPDHCDLMQGEIVALWSWTLRTCRIDWHSNLKLSISTILIAPPV